MKVQYSIALDSEGNKISIEEAKNGGAYFCPICGKKMIAKTEGTIRDHHFAHKEKCSETWTYDMSEWHKKWQSFFPGQTEVILKNDNEVHIADAIVDKTVIEFQHSPISLDEFRDRNRFYTHLHYKVIWIFDLTSLYKEGRIRQSIDNDIEYFWSYVKVPFKNMNLKNESAEIFIQLEEMTSNDETILHSIISENDDFKVFYSDKYQSMSVSSFIDYVVNGQAVSYKTVIDSKCTIDEDYYPFAIIKKYIPGGNDYNRIDSIYKLWKDNYKMMIVENIQTNVFFKVFNGQCKSGMRCFKNSDGYYNDSGRFTDIWGYYKPIWRIVLTVNRTEDETLKLLSKRAFSNWHEYDKRIQWEDPGLYSCRDLNTINPLKTIMDESYDDNFVAKEKDSDLCFLFKSNFIDTYDPSGKLLYYNAYIYFPDKNQYLADYPVNYYIRKHLNTITWQKLCFMSDEDRKRKKELESKPVYVTFEMDYPVVFSGEYSISEITSNNSKDFVAKNLSNNIVYVFKKKGDNGWTAYEFDLEKKQYDIKKSMNHIVLGTNKNTKWALNKNDIEVNYDLLTEKILAYIKKDSDYKTIKEIFKDNKSSKMYIECSKNNYLYFFTVLPKDLDDINILSVEVFDKNTGEFVSNIDNLNDEKLFSEPIWKKSDVTW